jgi:surface antigen
LVIMNKSLRNRNQTGIAHLVLIVLIVVVMGAIGYIGYNVYSQNDAQAVAKLGKGSCVLRGRVWSGGKCTNKCSAGTGSLKKDTYNYCTKSVTPSSSITKSNCGKLGRKWLSYNGCARYAKQKTLKSAPQCKGNATYHVAKFDYCGNRKAAATKIAKGGGTSSSSSSSGGAVSGGGNYKANCGKYKYLSANICNGQCVQYVRFALARSGIKVKGSMGNGKAVVSNLVSRHGFHRVSKPRAGAVFSKSTGGGGAGHTGIVIKVYSNGDFRVAETNYSKRLAYGERTVKSTKNYTFAVR